MTWIHGAWAVVGALLGAAHAVGIWRSVNRPMVAGAAVGLLRLAVVGLTLTAAAIYGSILPAAGGWAASFFVSGAALMVLRRRAGRRRADT